VTPGGGGKKSPTSFDQWVFWWSYNNDDLLNLKEAIYALKITKESALGQVGESSGARTDATRATEKQVKESLIPALLWAMDPKNKQHPDTESAAYIALAKVTDDPSHIPLLAAAVLENGKKPGVDQIVNESAILALGLLRRTQARQFDAKELDKVRDLLFEAFEADGLNSRARGFAALALGLLGDQPTTRSGSLTTGGGLFYAPDPVAAGLPTTGRIFDALKKKYSNSELYCCLMMSLSMQPVTEITPEMIDVLKECALKSKLFKDNVDDVTASYAALAIGKVGSAKDIPSMLNAITANQTGANVKRSASIALGLLGRRIDGVERANPRSSSPRPSRRSRSFDQELRDHVARVPARGVSRRPTDVLNARAPRSRTCCSRSPRTAVPERPYGALAIALVGRAIGDGRSPRVQPDPPAGHRRPQEASATQDDCARGVRGARQSGTRAPARTSSPSWPTGRDRELRGYAAVALGMIGSRTPDVVKAIKEALSSAPPRACASIRPSRSASSRRRTRSRCSSRSSRRPTARTSRARSCSPSPRSATRARSRRSSRS
jgi:HEAT repeat protein